MDKPVETYKCDNCHKVSSRGGVTLLKNCVLCSRCYLRWRMLGKPRCRACDKPVLNVKKHFLMNKDDRHLVLDIMTS